MTTPEIDQLAADCQQLRLTRVAATLPSLLEADARCIQLVLVNREGSALEFSAWGSTVTLTAYAVAMGDPIGAVCFSGDDRGRGIPAALRNSACPGTDTEGAPYQ